MAGQLFYRQLARPELVWAEVRESCYVARGDLHQNLLCPARGASRVLGLCHLKVGCTRQNFRWQPKEAAGGAWGGTLWSFWPNVVRGGSLPPSIDGSFLNAGRTLPVEVTKLCRCSTAKGRLLACW